MSVDRKQFNRSISTYEDVERHIQRAQRLRSEAIARIARRWATAVGAGVRRLRDVVGNGLRGDAEKGANALRFWAPVTSAPGRAARCK